jgi:hypothetical protein
MEIGDISHLREISKSPCFHSESGIFHELLFIVDFSGILKGQTR